MGYLERRDFRRVLHLSIRQRVGNSSGDFAVQVAGVAFVASGCCALDVGGQLGLEFFPQRGGCVSDCCFFCGRQLVPQRLGVGLVLLLHLDTRTSTQNNRTKPSTWARELVCAQHPAVGDGGTSARARLTASASLAL